MNTQRYLQALLYRFIGSDEVYRKGLVRLMMFENSSETALQSELTNSIIPPVTAAELHKLVFSSMEMSYYLGIVLLMQHG